MATEHPGDYWGRSIRVDLEYPRMEDKKDFVLLQLMDVRAANALIISYDFDRDGWVIASNLYDPDIDAWIDQPDIPREVSFVPSWPTAYVKQEAAEAVGTPEEVEALAKSIGLTKAELETFLVEYLKGTSEWYYILAEAEKGEEKAKAAYDAVLKYNELLGDTPWELTDNPEVLKPTLYQVYMNGLVDNDFYAREAEEDGLLAVYNAGREAALKEKN